MGLRRWLKNRATARLDLQRQKLTTAGRVIIAGTGRAGTTLLMRICTNLGLDTGFTRHDIREAEGNVGRAGLEKTINRETADSLPEIIKTPFLADVVQDALGNGWLKVDSAIVPVRELGAAAGSRRSVHDRAISSGLDPKVAPGGLWGVADPDAQEAALAQKFYVLVETLVAHQVPTTMVSFPRFAKDADYFVETLGGFFLARFGVSEEALRAAHKAETKVNFIGEHRK